MKRLAGWLLRWAMAVVVTAALGSAIQTQFNMSAVAALGAPMDFYTRLEMTMLDLAGFAPTWAMLVGIALLIAFGVAAGLARLRPAARPWLYPLAGGAGVLTLLLLLHALLPMTFIAATRSLAGTLSMAVPGLLGGWLFLRLERCEPATKVAR